jgi:hypothetical protein
MDRLAAGAGDRPQRGLPGGRWRRADGNADLSALPFRTAFFRPIAAPLSSWPAATVAGSGTKQPWKSRCLPPQQPALFLLCHPHNPVGRCWKPSEELLDLAAFAEENDLVVCSDEIHCGLILDADKRHIPFASLSPDAAKRSITLMAPSKTYNIPGLGCAFAVIPDAALRRRFLRAMDGIVPHVNVLGLAACEAAYRDCWRLASSELIAYLRGNRDRVFAAVNAQKGAKMSHVEATYLAWIDVRELGPGQPGRPFRGAWPRPLRWRRFRRAGLAAPQFRLCAQHAGRSACSVSASCKRGMSSITAALFALSAPVGAQSLVAGLAI